MKRKFYLMNNRFMPEHSDNDMTAMEMWKQIYSRHRPKENFRNEIAKVYQIHAHGKFTVIVRLHVHPTTPTNPCYRSHISSICGSYMDDRTRERTGRKPWNSFYQKMRQMIHDEITPTLIVHSSTTQTHLPILIEQDRSYTGLLLLSLFVISILIIGGILWYVFARTSHSSKSTVRIESENNDDDYDHHHHQYPIKRRNYSETDVNPFQTNKAVGSFVFNSNNNNNCFEEQSLKQDEKIDYQNIQMLIENLQQSNLESVNPSTIGQILSDLIHQAVNSTSDLSIFFSYGSHFVHILRSVITNKCTYNSSNPNNFLQCQYLIEILYHTEFILTHLQSHKSASVTEILTHLYRILASINSNSHRHQSICQSLVDLVEQIKQ